MHLHKQLLAFSTIVICASAAHFLEQEWNSWKIKYEKKYTSLDQELFRRKAWEATWEKVQKHNQLADQGLKKYRLAMNHFADMTSKERNSRSCVPSTKKQSASNNVPAYSYGKYANLPEHVDWRDSKCVSPARNQGSLCGSCWAFATVGVIESRYCIKNDELISLSEQQLVDCDEKNEGCCGGFPVNALQYVSHHGVMRSKDYEYTQTKFTCKYDPDEALKVNISKFYLVPEEENMAAVVAHEGPITVGFGVMEDFQLYEQGVYDGECAEEANHAIIIVGYGTEKGEEDDEAEDYWIIKNSWGKEWGENGFAKIKRNVNKCDIAGMAATADIL